MFVAYVALMRKLQTTYWLEPAGSHGVSRPRPPVSPHTCRLGSAAPRRAGGVQAFGSLGVEPQRIGAPAALPQSRHAQRPGMRPQMWGLDDYCFLPFYFGSSQLLSHYSVRPNSIHRDDVLQARKVTGALLGCRPSAAPWARTADG